MYINVFIFFIFFNIYSISYNLYACIFVFLDELEEEETGRTFAKVMIKVVKEVNQDINQAWISQNRKTLEHLMTP